MAANDASKDLILHVGDRLLNADQDLTFGEKRQIRLLVRGELWDEDLQGPFDWAEVPDEEFIAATVAVWMKRDRPDDTLTAILEDVMRMKPSELINGNGASPKGSPARSSKRKTSATSGTQT